MPILKKLNDGSVISFNNDEDPNFISRRVHEKNLEIKQNLKQNMFRNSPDYQPGVVLNQEDIGTFGAVGRGALSGLVSLATEPVGTAGLLLQAAGAEQAGDELVKRAESVQERFSPNIEGLGLAAELPKALVQFGIPGGLVLKATKGMNKAAQLAALGAAEGLVAEADMQTFGDIWIDGGPTKTRELENLEGQEKAFASLYNKGKVGLEASALAAGLPIALGAGGKVLSGSATVLANTPGLKETFKGAQDLANYMGKGVDEVLKNNPMLDKGASFFRYRGALPTKEAAEIRDARALEFGAYAQANKVALEELQLTMDTVFKQGDANGVTSKSIIDAIDGYLYPTDEILTDPSMKAGYLAKQNEAAKALIEADQTLGLNTNKMVNPNTESSKIDSNLSLFRAAKRVRETIDEYSKRIMQNPEFLPEGVEDTIGGQLGVYATRQYRAFISDNFVPDEEKTKRAVDYLMRSGGRDSEAITEQQAREFLFDLVNKNGFVNSSLSPKNLVEEKVLKKVNDGILKGRSLNDESIRDFLGEYVTKPKFAGREIGLDERKVNLLAKSKETLTRQAAIISKGNFIKYLEEYDASMPLDKKIFLDFLPADAFSGAQKYMKVPETMGYGNLQGKYVREDYFKALEKQNDSWYQNVPVIGSAYSALLGLKGLSQLAKTVYNPSGQVRNVSGAFGFTLANGNLPTGKTFAESFSVIAANINNKFKSDAAKKEYFEKLTKKGLVGKQAQLGELNSLIDEAAGASGLTGKIFGSGYVQKAQNNIMTKLYQSGDDLFRIINYESEYGKLLSMVQKSQVNNQPFMMKATTIEQRQIAKSKGLDPENFNVLELDDKKLIKEFLDEEAAMITRDVVPNYERVPRAVDMLRKLPLGNFIAYPAELIRTSGNILGRAIKESASDNVGLRQRGLERLLGFGAITTGIPQGVTALGLNATGATEEQLAAYKRSAAYDWDKNATLVPVKTDEDGNILEVVNLSYTMPYDYLTAPFAAVQNAVTNGIRSEKELSDIAVDAMGGVISNLFSPFFGESIITERLVDVSPIMGRGGVTGFGRRVYEETDSVGEKVDASFAHILNGLIPVMSPATLDKSVFSLRLADLPKSALVEGGLIDPRYRVSRGKQLDFAAEITEAMTGVKSIRIDMKRSLGYKAEEAKSEIRRANADLRAFAKEYGPKPPEEALEAYKKTNEIRYKALRDLSVTIDDARHLGMSTGEIASVLKDRGVSNWQAVMSHKFIPYKPSADLYRKAYEATDTKIRNVMPFDEMRRSYGEELRERPNLPAPLPIAPRQPKPDLSLFPSKSAGTQNPFASEEASQVLREQEIKKLMGVT